MTVNSKYENFKYSDVIKAARNMGISKIKADNIIKEVKKAIKKFKNFAIKEKMNKKTINYILLMMNENVFD